MTDYLVWVAGQLLGSVGYGLAYAVEAFLAAYAARKAWDMAGRR